MKLILLIIFPIFVQASDVLTIYRQIIVNKPSINKDYAAQLANIIVMESKQVQVSPQLFTAILMQESSYSLTAKNCKETEDGYEVCTDYGISQIHYKTVGYYKFDKKKLTTDLVYSIKAGLKVLSDFQIRYASKEEDYWTRYNSPSPKARKIYRDRVMKWL